MEHVGFITEKGITVFQYMPSIKKMTTEQILNKYRKISGRNPSKFSSRAAGELQLARAMERADKKKRLAEAKANKGKKMTEEVNKRSLGTKASWQVEMTNYKRRLRHHVIVEGHGEFRSVKAAFEELELPLKKHIKFRALLKAEGQAEFEGYKFTLVC